MVIIIIKFKNKRLLIIYILNIKMNELLLLNDEYN
jgi:hypothetical protein